MNGGNEENSKTFFRAESKKILNHMESFVTIILLTKTHL